MPTTYIKGEKIRDAVVARSLYKPTHPDLFEVVYAEGNYNSKLIACRDFSESEIICDIKGATPAILRRDNMMFFYPASEWDMEQPFTCWCCAQQCIGNVQGAKSLSKDTLSRYFVTHHIQKLLSEREA
ncbi:hypothetical protein EC991_008226 [Linnemannia zychae]|nr:hypothetical protein EC991_008226 [Linnemannia zychae]